MFLSKVGKVFTTPAGADRLAGNAVGIHVWETIEVPKHDNRVITITGTPCRHGPPNGDRGPVTGFVLNFKGDDTGAVYISGDTVWYEGVEEISRRFDIKIVLLFMGAAVVKNVGPDHLTMTIDESMQVANHFAKAKIVPLHFEGWEHFTESRSDIEERFKKAGLLDRLQWAE
jgi:L-ascorbate metabolism protein UlaG (beta-lactamase superfamily)